MVGPGVTALIPRQPVLVADLHAAPAGAAKHNALTQRAAFPRWAGSGVGAVGDQLGLVSQVLLETDVAGVVILDQDFPLVAGQLGGRGVHRAIRVDDLAGAPSPEYVRAGIDRVAQDPSRAGMGEPAPAQLPGPHPAIGPAGKAPPGEGAGDPVGRAGLGERGEHITDRGGDFGIGIDDDPALVVVDEPDRQRHAQLTPGRGSPFGLLQPAGQPVQLGFRHLAFHAQQQPVVDVGQVIDAVIVDDQGVGQAGQLQQAGQIGVGASQPGYLQPEHRSDLAQTHPGDQRLEPVSMGGAATGQPQIGIDDLDVGTRPAQSGCLRGQVVLAHRRLGVLADLH